MKTVQLFFFFFHHMDIWHTTRNNLTCATRLGDWHRLVQSHTRRRYYSPWRHFRLFFYFLYFFYREKKLVHYYYLNVYCAWVSPRARLIMWRRQRLRPRATRIAYLHPYAGARDVAFSRDVLSRAAHGSISRKHPCTIRFLRSMAREYVVHQHIYARTCVCSCNCVYIYLYICMCARSSVYIF